MWVLVVVALILLACFLLWRKKIEGLPPGPTALPFLGNALQMHQNQFLTMTKWKEQYGDTITCFVGSKPMVVLHDLETVKTVFNEDKTTGRDADFLGNFNHSFGLIFSDGELWKEHRRFAISTLKDLGMGKSSLEEHILAEVEGLCSVLREFSDEPMFPQPYINLSVSNVICALTFGKRFSHADEKFRKLVGLIGENVGLVADDQVLQTFPFLKYVPGKFRQSYAGIQRNIRQLSEFLTGLIKDHNKKFVAHDVRDYIDMYLRQAMQEKETGTTGSTFDDTQLMASILDLFIAGTETTSTTLLWSFVHLLNHPEVQQRIQEEIDSKVGRHTVVTMDHKDRCLDRPVLHAVLERSPALSPGRGNTIWDTFCRFRSKNNWRSPSGVFLPGPPAGVSGFGSTVFGLGEKLELIICCTALLPYTEATILEVQRASPLVPFGAPHRNYEPITIDGYKIPPNTLIAANIYSILHDTRYWIKPEKFDPTRYIDAEGKTTKPAAHIPFAIGKRACLGEALAKTELFLFFSNILRNFKLEAADGKIPRPEAVHTGIVTTPLPFDVIFVPR